MLWFRQIPPPGKPWPPGLKDEVNSVDDGKTNNLPRLACLDIGAPVVLHKNPQFVLLGICNHSDGITRNIKLDPREPYIRQPNQGFSVVNLKFPPIHVLVYIETADDAGLQLPGFPLGVIRVFPVERQFAIIGVNQWKFTFTRNQLSLTAGCLSSVCRSQ